jgi:hypothetical protein
MATSLRSRRIAELQARAKRTDILWMHRRNALHCLTGVQRLGEKTIAWCQRLINSMRDQYSDLEVQKEIDALQERLDRQRELLKRRLSRDEAKEEETRPKKPTPQPPQAPGAAPIELWQSIFEGRGENE